MKVLKFGGKSLANGKGLARVLSIIAQNQQDHRNDPIIAVVSARGTTTNALEQLLESAKQQKDYQVAFESFKAAQIQPMSNIDFEKEFELLAQILKGVYLLEDYSDKIKDLVLAQGELLSAKMVVALLKARGFKARFKDSRHYFRTNDDFNDATIIDELSNENIQAFYKEAKKGHIYIFTGFIGANLKGETTTLGRNGSNYSAALLASYISAEILENYTHVDGIYTANPMLVPSAKRIEALSFQQALELAHFGTEVINAKAMIPLIEKQIPLKIISTFDPENKGTLIHDAPLSTQGIQVISVLENMALINLEGKGLLNRFGIDARIFTALAKEQISVSIISQGASERGISFLVKETQATKARTALANEFNLDFISKDVGKISIKQDVFVLSVLGDTQDTLGKAYQVLLRNNINPLLINNTINNKNVSIIIERQYLKKAVNVVHSEIFGVVKNINIAIFGVGTVGGTLMNQLLQSKKEIAKRKGIALNVFAIANSKKAYIHKTGIDTDWRTTLQQQGKAYQISDIINFAQTHHLTNLIAVDNTASEDFTHRYKTVITHGFDLVSSNKIANTLSYQSYVDLRQTLKKYHKKYRYETNVGAGLPLIDTISLLHNCGENITRIRGVFSGTLSYLFNEFSIEDQPFSAILQTAIDAGFTEPDPREDLNGNDVARKLLILARELDLKNEFTDIEIENLIPSHLRSGSKEDFLNRLTDFDESYQRRKDTQKQGHVLRYVGDLYGDLSANKGKLKVSLVSVPTSAALGKVTGADAIFEIYTDAYASNPLVIQGAGAGAAVTARGVFGDILKLADLESNG